MLQNHFWLQIAFVTAIGDISSNSPMTVRWESASSWTFCHSHYRYFQKRAKNCQKRNITKGCDIHANYIALFYYSHNWPFSKFLAYVALFAKYLWYFVTAKGDLFTNVTKDCQKRLMFIEQLFSQPLVTNPKSTI